LIISASVRAFVNRQRDRQTDCARDGRRLERLRLERARAYAPPPCRAALLLPQALRRMRPAATRL